jgi:hypothetical protein
MTDEALTLELKLRLALEAVTERRLFKSDERNIYGEGFLAGFDKAMELAFSSWSSVLNKKDIKDETTTKNTKVIIRRRAE